jgi:PAS domain S-box-containing protein
MGNTAGHKEAKSAIWASDENYRMLVETTSDFILVMDLEGIVVYINQAVKNIANGFKIEGRHITDIIPAGQIDRHKEQLRKRREGIDDRWNYQADVVCPRGRIIHLDITSTLLKNKGMPSGVLFVAKDKTHQKQVQKQLEDYNTALKVLLQHRDEERKTLGSTILSNIKEVIMPCLERLKKSKVNSAQKTDLELLESRLKSIMSPFSDALSSTHPRMTNQEVQIVNLVMEGRSTKEIADVLHIAERTVSFHRNRIRKKLGICNKKTDLKSHLFSISSSCPGGDNGGIGFFA